ncbi:MAG: RDD family protein [Acidobacteriota bacterium]|nr:RDD family protein [Acidobacteriota bacterium]
MKCPECGAFRNRTWVDPEQAQQQSIASPVKTPKPAEPAIALTSATAKSTPSLIEFPGITKTSKPEWRKELGERVREAQERRAREASVETCDTEPPTNGDVLKPTPVLELLPQAEIQPLNPIVAAALQRLERANAQQQFSGNTAVARQVAYEAPPQLDGSPSNGNLNSSSLSERETTANDSPPPERVRNLAVVRSPAVQQVEISESRKPKRLIRGENDPALNYLDSIQTTGGFDIRKHTSASVPLRIVSGIIDLLVVCLLASPALALLNLTQLNWQDFRVITFTAAAFILTGFLYHTVVTALTGRTVGMRLCSLRVVDARTGLIPTGAQSAVRALVYMLSVASAGIGFIYTFFDREKRAAHDRFTRTAVVRV